MARLTVDDVLETMMNDDDEMMFPGSDDKSIVNDLSDDNDELVSKLQNRTRTTKIVCILEIWM